MTIQLTPKQQKAVDICLERYKNGEKYTTIAGVAGAGKSTIVNFVIKALNLTKEEVRFVAFTGKAAQVLQQKGLNATTIHKLIYNSYLNKKTGRFSYSKKPKEEVGGKVWVVDEVSLISKDLLNDLASYGVHMILLGDPFQLPSPVGKDNGMLNNPHIFLDEVMRQALDNPIVYLSMLVREGKEIPMMDNEHVKVIKKKDLTVDMLNWGDQVICGLNSTRKYLNNIIRESKGFHGLPQVGDKMICLKNDWETVNSEDVPIINGLTGTIEKIHSINSMAYGDTPIKHNQSGIIVDFKPDFTSTFHELNMDPNVVRGMDSVLQQQINSKYKKIESIYQEMDYGYVISAWKSQGSEWNNVVAIVEQVGPTDIRKLAYTIITRAKEKLILVID